MIIVTSVAQKWSAAPNIFAGTTADGGTIYARYRWGHLSIRIQPAGVDDGTDGAAGTSIFEIDYGGQYDGHIDYQAIRNLTRSLIEWPEICH